MSARRFTRYFCDPAFRAAVDAQFAGADLWPKHKGWITYAIHDPTQEDMIGNEPDGLIIYVGQTKEFGKRVRKRMRNAGTAVRKPTDRIDGACYDIMMRGGVPRFTVREIAATAIDSLVSETNMARQLHSLGYPLLNKWDEQKSAGPAIGRLDVPHARLWQMTAEDALGSGIGVDARDGASGEICPIDLTSFPSTTRLSAVRLLLDQRGLKCRLHIDEPTQR